MVRLGHMASVHVWRSHVTVGDLARGPAGWMCHFGESSGRYTPWLAIPVVENVHVFQEPCANVHISVVSKVGNKCPLTGERVNKSGIMRHRNVAVLAVKALVTSHGSCHGEKRQGHMFTVYAH